MLFAFLASAACLSVERVAHLLKNDPATVAAWMEPPVRAELIQRIRARAGQEHALGYMAVLASVLGVSVPTVDAHLHGRAPRSDKEIATRPRLSQRRTVESFCQGLGCTEEEYVQLFERTPFKDDAGLHKRQAKGRRTRWGGRTCMFVRRIVHGWARGELNSDIAAEIQLDGVPDAPTAKDVSFLPMRHVRETGCPKCRPLVVFHLHMRGGRSVREIADDLGISPATVSADLAATRPKMPLFAHRLTIQQAARRIGISTTALRWQADQGHIRCERTPNGWRVFSRDDVDEFIRHQNLRDEP